MSDMFDLEHSAVRFPNHVAIRAGNHVLSYQDVWAAALNIAHHLCDHGVTEETAWLAIEPRKDLPSVLTIWTLISLGLPFIVLHPSWSNTQKAAVVSQTAAQILPIPTPPAVALGSSAPYTRLARTTKPEDPLCVVYTSGTTGAPKGAILSRRAFVASAQETQRWLRLEPNDRWFLSLPLAHVGGLSVLTRTLLAHASVVLPPTEDSSFDATQFIQQCIDNCTTLVSLVPTQLQRICAKSVRAPSSLRCVLLGGAPAAPSLLARANQLGFRVVRTYGLTELCSVVATESLEHAGCEHIVCEHAGYDHTACERTVNPSAFLPLHAHVHACLSAEGRLMLRGEALFSGYWGETVTTPNDWFTTGDLAELTDDQVRILGRADDVIVTGGEKVHPANVESALLACSGIEQACVFGRPSEEWGQELCAALVTTDGFAVSAAVSHLRRSVPSFNIPRAWAIVSRLPTTPNGKIHRPSVARDVGPLCQRL